MDFVWKRPFPTIWCVKKVFINIRDAPVSLCLHCDRAPSNLVSVRDLQRQAPLCNGCLLDVSLTCHEKKNKTQKDKKIWYSVQCVCMISAAKGDCVLLQKGVNTYTCIAAYKWPGSAGSLRVWPLNVVSVFCVCVDHLFFKVHCTFLFVIDYNKAAEATLHTYRNEMLIALLHLQIECSVFPGHAHSGAEI